MGQDVVKLQVGRLKKTVLHGRFVAPGGIFRISRRNRQKRGPGYHGHCAKAAVISIPNQHRGFHR
jgi:hypothetical protein